MSTVVLDDALAKIKIQTLKIQELYLALVLSDDIVLFKFLVCAKMNLPIYKKRQHLKNMLN